MKTYFVDEFNAIKHELESLLFLLTNRSIELIFEPRLPTGSQVTLNSVEPKEPILFSGGVDSVAGAMKFVSENRKNVLIHIESSKQIFGKVRKILSGEFLRDTETFCVSCRIKSRRHLSFFSDTRGLLYLTVGYVVSKYINCMKLIFCENGAQMLDVMLGSMAYNNAIATKNTNLKYLVLVENLLSRFEGNRFMVEYPFKNNTKSESISRYLRPALVEKAWSCYSGRGRKSMCGSCWNCFVTKMSGLAAGIPSQSLRFNTDPLTDSLASPLYLDNQRILYNLMVFYEKVVNGNSSVVEELRRYKNWFEDPVGLATRFGLDLFLGISVSLSSTKARNGLGRKAYELLSKIDRPLLRDRKEYLMSLKKSSM